MTNEAPADAGQAGNEQPAATWYAGFNLPDEDVGYIQNKGWDDPIKPFQAYKELEKLRGVPAEQLIKLPKDMADKEAMRQVYARLGMPESVDGYKYEAKENMDVERADYFKGVAHELGLNAQQFNALLDKAYEYETAAGQKYSESIKAQQESQMESLKKEWGNAFEERAELGRRAVKTFLPKEGQEAILNTLEGSIGTAVMLKIFANIGEKLGEDKIVESDSRPFGQTTQQVKANIEQLKNEVKADPVRLANFNKGMGADYQRMQKLIQQSVA